MIKRENPDLGVEGESLMIKLIASDMDGTLLSRQDGLPADFFEVMEETAG